MYSTSVEIDESDLSNFMAITKHVTTLRFFNSRKIFNQDALVKKFSSVMNRSTVNHIELRSSSMAQILWFTRTYLINRGRRVASLKWS